MTIGSVQGYAKMYDREKLQEGVVKEKEKEGFFILFYFSDCPLRPLAPSNLEDVGKLASCYPTIQPSAISTSESRHAPTSNCECITLFISMTIFCGTNMVHHNIPSFMHNVRYIFQNIFQSHKYMDNVMCYSSHCITMLNST